MTNWDHNEFFIPLEKISTRQSGGFKLKPSVYSWLVKNDCYKGPDRFFVSDLKDARPFETWGNIDNTWAKLTFNHSDMARRFLIEFGGYKPEFKYQVKYLIRSGASFSLNDIYCFLATELMDLAKKGILEDLDFHWMLTKISHDNFDTTLEDSEVLFSFADLQTALMFKLTYGGTRCLVP